MADEEGSTTFDCPLLMEVKEEELDSNDDCTSNNVMLRQPSLKVTYFIKKEFDDDHEEKAIPTTVNCELQDNHQKPMNTTGPMQILEKPLQKEKHTISVHQSRELSIQTKFGFNYKRKI